MVAASLFAVATLGFSRWFHFPLLPSDGLPVIVFAAGIWAGTAFTLITGNRPARMPVLGTEVVVLTAMALVSTGLLFVTASASGGSRAAIVVDGDAEQTANLLWKFDLPDKGAIDSSPVIVGERVYIAAAQDKAFRPYGA